MTDSHPYSAPTRTHLLETAADLVRQQRWEAAASIYRETPRSALSLGDAIRLAACLYRMEDVAQAEDWIQRIVQARGHDPLVKGHLWALGAELLREGRYREGWPLLEHRIGLSPDLIPPIGVSYPEWKGEPLDGKSILIWVEQGLGDQIMLSRFSTVLTVMGAKVTLACNPILERLFQTIEGVADVVPIPVGGGAAVRKHDYWTRYFSMPAVLKTTLDTLPNAPYLRGPPVAPRNVTGVRRLGLTWKTSATGATSATKTLPSPIADELFALGAISLDPADTGAKDMMDTATIVSDLDLVITVDTSTAHLAGAMGKATWVLLPHVADWRWLQAREDSPWYPSVRLFRQDKPGDWSGPVQQVREALVAL